MVGRRGDSGVRRDLIAALRSSKPAQEVIAGAGRDRQLAIGFIERDGLARRVYAAAVRVEGDGVGVLRPLGRQGDVLLNSIGEDILFIAQIPAVEGIARAGRVGRLGRGEAVFHFLLGRNRRAAVRIESDGILVDVPLRRQGDVLCDGGIKVILGGVLLVFAQIPEGKGKALERRVCRFLCIQTVFDHLRVNLAAAVGIEGDFVLVDLPLCRQGDVLCDGGIKVILGGLLLVFAQIPEGKGIALERRLGRRDSLLAALDVLLIGRRITAVSVEGNGIFLRHTHEALRLALPAAPGPDQRDRNDLLIVLDMFQIRERLVELGHIGVGVIADVAKPVVPVLLRLADEVVFIVLAEQIVAVLMLLQFIYVALDLNSHFKLFQLVSRRGFGLHRRPLRNIGHSLRDLFCDFGLPACEGVAGAVRGFAERGGRIAGLKASGDPILEDYLAFNAVGVGDGEGVGGRCYFALDIEGWNAVLLPDALACFLVLREVPEFEHANMCGAVRFRVAFIQTVERVDKRRDGLCNCAFDVIAVLAVIFALRYIPDRIGVAIKRSCQGVLAVVVMHNRLRLHTLDLDSRVIHVIVICAGLVGLVDGRGHRRVMSNVNVNGGIVAAILPPTEIRIPIPCDSLRCRLACLQIVCAVLVAKLLIVCSQILVGIEGHDTDPRIGGLGQNRAVIGNDITKSICVINLGDIIEPCLMVIGITPHVDSAQGGAGRVDIVAEALYVVFGGFAGRLDLAVTNRYSKRYRISIPVGIYRDTIIRYQPIIIEICKRYACRASCFRRITELKRRHICIARETRVYKRKLAVSNYAFL